MIKPRKLVFGTAGIPLSSPKNSTFEGIKYTYEELKLEGLEMEFVYGVRLKDEEAQQIKEYLSDKEFILTAHGPYYINLNANEKAKIERSISMIADSAKKLYMAGGYSVVFHPGWYMKSTKEEAYENVKSNLKKAVKEIRDNGYDVWIRPETMEGAKKFGDIDEVIKLSQEIEGVLPCIDFAHLRYRYNDNSIEFFRNILEKIEKELGKEALENMHIHMSGIKMDKAGTHINLEESDMPWKDILDLLKEFKVKGIVISESPNIEEDAKRMMDYYYPI